MKPIGDRIIVEPESAETVRASGLVIPDQAAEKPMIGTVLEVGPGVDDGEAIDKGSRVAYSRYGGTELKLREKEYVVLRISDVLAVLDEDE